MKKPSIPPLVQKICQGLVDKKGENILALDVQGISSITDYFIIAEGSVGRHVNALAHHVMEIAEEANLPLLHKEGLAEGDWVVLDYMDIIVHLFIPELRHYYSLEEVWKEGKVLSIPVEYGRVKKEENHKTQDEKR